MVSLLLVVTTTWPGPLIGLTNDTECQGTPMNALIVSSNGLAMLFEPANLCCRVAGSLIR